MEACANPTGSIPPDIMIGMRSVRARTKAALSGVRGLTPARLEAMAKLVRVAFYVGAIEGFGVMRPSHAYRFGAATNKRTSEVERIQYVKRQPRSVRVPWFGTDRETVRKSIYTLVEEAAAGTDDAVSTNNALARYALSREFAAIFEDVEPAVWKARVNEFRRAASLRKLERKRLPRKELSISLPCGGTRKMSVGPGSDLTKVVVEKMITAHAVDPELISIADTKNKLPKEDAERLKSLSLKFSAKDTLPDIVFLDKKGTRLNVVEAVATGGWFTKKRMSEVTRIAAQSGFSNEGLRLISAFWTRDGTMAKKAFGEQPSRVRMWFADEPGTIFGALHRPSDESL